MHEKADNIAAAGRGVSQRSDVEPFLAMDVLREAHVLEAQGRDICHLEVGQPGFSAPAPVLEAARNSLDAGGLGYTEATGIPSLRARIAQHYADTYGVDISPRRVIATTGSSAGFTLAFLGLFDQGDRLALTAPGYPAYRNILKALGIELSWIRTDLADRTVPSADYIAQAHEKDGISGLLLASPGNPTGTVVQPDRLAAIAAETRARNLWFISDEIYHGLTYAGEADTALRHDPDAIVINSFSKYYCMTGWRIGWMIVPDRLVRTFERLAQSLFICPPALSQIAAAAAFDATDELETCKRVYARNRQLLLERLPTMGIDRFFPADGAFYIYADIGRFTNDSGDFAARLLRDAGVAATPGADFDPEEGNRYLRLSFAAGTPVIEAALDRLDGFLKSQG